MIDRRRFLSATMMVAALPLLPRVLRVATITIDHAFVIKTAREQQWNTLPIGELMGRIGKLFVGTPYVGGTLEGPGPETCRVIYDKLDCVTYFELVLALARGIISGCDDEEAIVAEVTRTRYRNGKLDGYTSRLHYTSEWISDNVTKKVVVNITEGSSEAVVFENRVDFMSTHPQFYAPLKENDERVNEIKTIEETINATRRWYVPKNRIAAFEPTLQTGDIVAVATSKKGLDYAHTGMILVDENGARRFMHASTTKKAVVIDTTISEYVRSVASHTGITVVRPRDPDFRCVTDE